MSQRQVDQFQDDSKTSQSTKARIRRKIESRNTSRLKQVETTKVEFLKSIFFQFELVQERSNLKVEVTTNLNTSRVEAEAIWID